MVIEMLTLLALVQSSAAEDRRERPAPTESVAEVSPDLNRQIDELVKQVVSQTRPVEKGAKKATSRPATPTRAKADARTKADARAKTDAPAKATSRPAPVKTTKQPAAKTTKVAERPASKRTPRTLRTRSEPPAAPPVRAAAQPKTKPPVVPAKAAQRKVPARPSTQQAMRMLDELPELTQLRGRVEVIPTGPGTIAIQGDEEAVAALEEIIRILDATEVPLKLEIHQLKNARATQLAPTLSQLLRQALSVPGRRAKPSDEIVILPDARSNSLLIGAVPERMGEIKTIIEQLDSQPLIGPVAFKTFVLKHMRASEASELLQQMIQRLQAQRGVPGEAITIVPDDRTNTLIVTAPEADFKHVGEMIDMIDIEPAFATAKMIHIPLMNADADALETVLNELVNQRMGGRRGQAVAEQIRRLQLRTKSGKDLPELDLEKPIKVTADTGTNSLLIGSTEQNLKAMEEIVKLFDAVPVSKAVVVRIFPLKDADAQDLAKMIQTIFTEGKALSAGPGGRQRGRAVAVPDSISGEAMMYNIGLAADTRTNTLIASGRDEQVAFVQEMVDHLDKPGLASRWPIKLHPLEHADAQRLSTVLQRLMTERQQTLQKMGMGKTGAERENVLIMADIRSNSLIILGRDENFQEVVELAKKLDTAQDIAGDVRMIHLDKTQANVIQPKIEQLWQRRSQLLQQGGGVRDTPVIVSDERSNSLIVASSKEDFEAIQTLVKRLEEAPLTPIADIRIIRLENSDSSVLAPTLRQLFDERMRMRQTPGARPIPSDQVAIFPDPVVNALLVASSQENFDTMMELIKKLDVEMPLEGVVRFFKLNHADVTRVSDMLERMFKAGLYKPGTLGKESAVSKARDKVVIEPDMRSNSLIVSASKENYSIIEKLIKEVDVKDAPFMEGNVQLFKVKYADVVKLSNMMQEVLRGIQTFRQKAGPELPVTIIPDEATKTLVISGSRDVLSQAGSLLEQLDVESDTPSRDIIPYPLKFSSAAKVADILTDLFQEKRRSGGRGVTQGTEPFVRADDTANILIVSASKEDHKVVESLLKHIDVKSEASQRMEVFPLEKAQAEELQQVIEDLYSQQQTARGRGGRGAGPGVSLSTDPQTNSLIVWAPPSEMEDIAKLVKQLDTTNPKDETRVRIFRLKQADAEDLAKVLTNILTGRGAQGGGSRRGGGADSVLISYGAKDPQTGEETIRKLLRRNVQIVPEKLTNSLLVRAEPDSLAMLAELIESIDSIPPREVDVQVFHLVNADASEMVKVLEKLFKVGESQRRGRSTTGEEETVLTLASAGVAGGLGAEGGPAGRQLLSFTPDTRTNSVIAAGTEEYLLIAAKLVRQLDEQEIEDRTNMVYQVKFAEAKDLESALKSHFKNISDLYKELGDEEAKLRQIEREVSVVADEKSGSLLVSASPRYESQVMKMIADLDRPPAQVMVQVLIAEVTLDDRVEMGLEFAVQDLLFSETAYVGNNNTIKAPNGNYDFVVGTDLGAAGSTLGGFSFTITGEDFNFLLRALQIEGRLEVLSRPQIMAEDNQKASISIGQEVPFVQGSTVTSGGNIQTQVSYEKVGIILDVTPRINPDGYVSLDVAPEISAITDSSVQVSAGVFAPIFNKREAETSVTVKDGETVVIGGLITTENEHRESKLPIIGDIPGLGNLFRTTVSSKTKTELLIVLTPVVVKNEREARALSEEERDKIDLLPYEIKTSPLMEKLKVAPEDMPLAPRQFEQEVVPAEPTGPAAERPVRSGYGPAKPGYGPARPKLISQRESPPPATPGKPMVGPDSFEHYLQQRR
ncbi:MAG: hypothetical protein JXQ73_17540 [Phycisphaerae bacterium]|nr:hypothetical protein [Phycisphaerae bacterium]